jgi:dynein heavy chain
MLQAIGRQFSALFLPVLNNMAEANWGKMAGKEGQMAKIDFLGKLSTFVATLNGAQESINERVVLKKSDKYDFNQIQNTSDYITVANNTEALSNIEEIVKIWMKQIELVLAESEQIRREADNIGPRAELDYWKRRTSKFNYLLDQIKGHEVKSALGVLMIAKSRLLVKWRELDTKITDLGNEARDNVKYLYTLERFCDPLYNSDPVSMLTDIPGLINAIRMIHSISRYYNTSERMTSLFVKVTNQMITACKSYASEKGTQTIWSQPQTDLIKKLKDCIRLNKEYQNAFQKTKEKLAQMPDERPFDFSEMYIFGKFDTFTKRCQKIIDVFDAITTYSKLSESKIEGMELLAAKFNGIVATLKKKPYDFLDQRRADFDNDYEDFKKAIGDLHVFFFLFLVLL